jgi:predicted nucleotidyltransferase
MASAEAVAVGMQADARAAAELHARSRALLIAAARRGAAAGMTQRQIAEALERSQPEISRLLRFHGSTELGLRVSKHRSEILEVLSRGGARRPKVFGSVANGTDKPGSDIDLLVEIDDGVTLFSLARLERQLSELLGAPVDLVPADGLRKHLAERVLSEAIPL